MDRNKNKFKIYSIGYSSYSIKSFVDILKRYKIEAIADVRSNPYSQFKPEFNKDNLEKTLKNYGIKYVFLGNEVGARVELPECYGNEKVNYQLLGKHPLFHKGLQRIRNGMQKYRMALMCAEKDPINCHRAILICRHLKNQHIEIIHIVNGGNLEDHRETERRLMKFFKLDQPDLFISNYERLEEAYNMQGEKIAYKRDDEYEQN